MRHINKKPYSEFIEYVKKKKPKNWNNLDSKLRENTRKYILEEEQENQCAYTEIPLFYKENKSHIEHLKRKVSFPRLTFDWNNLFVSGISEDFGGKYKDNKYLKGKTKEDNELIINPALENPSDFFELAKWGEILIKEGLQEHERTRAQETINAFNLNHKSLKERRKRLIIDIQTLKDKQISSEEIKKYLSGEGFKSILENEL